MQTQVVEEQHTPVEAKTFYSRSQGLILHPRKGERVMVDGQLQRVNEKIIEFQPCDVGFGSYTTDDPEIIAFLEKRVAEVKDVLSVEQYNDAIIPDEMKVAGLRQQNTEQSRMIAEQNRLIAELQRNAANKKSVTPPLAQ